MSVEALAIALHHSSARTPAELAVLIGIANHDGDGGSWPTVATLSHYARIQRRHVQTCLVALERLGEIRRDIQNGGTLEINKWDRPNLYHFLLTCPKHCDGSRNHRLVCQRAECTKPLPKSYQKVYYHPGCEPLEEALEAESDGVAHSAPPAPQTARGVAHRPPKPSLEPLTRLNNESHLPERARELEEKDGYADAFSADSFARDVVADSADALPVMVSPSTDVCPKWPALRAPHALNKDGECIDCGALSEFNPRTGEAR